MKCTTEERSNQAYRNSNYDENSKCAWGLQEFDALAQYLYTMSATES